MTFCNASPAPRVSPCVKLTRRALLLLFPCLILAASALLAQQDLPPRSAQHDLAASDSRNSPRRWIVVLNEPPVAEMVEGRSELRASARARLALQRVQGEQSRLRSMLNSRRIRVSGATDTLLNAVFVNATARDAQDIAAMPGVARVVPDRPMKRTGTRAKDLVNAPSAWYKAGGRDAAGLGVKIGVIDTGIDQTHPAFQDNALPDTPKSCAPADCAYATRKIIAVRSYVSFIATPGDPLNSRPDDMTPRDRVGHGTAVAALAAGVSHQTPLGVFSGVAPKAYLGNYKVFGSPGVNDVTFASVLTRALEDSIADGMDVVTLSLGAPALFGAEDTAPTGCTDLPDGTSCDPFAGAVRNAARLGLTVVAAAGNSGGDALVLPSSNSIESPGAVPEAITVGATTNSHYLSQAVRATGGAVPDRLSDIPSLLGDGPRPTGPISARLVNVANLQNDGRACAPLPASSLNDSFALVQAGGCSARDKVANAFYAGAKAVVFMRAPGDNFVFAPGGLAFTPIPLTLIGYDDGVALRDFISLNPDRPVTIDPAFSEVGNPLYDQISFFSSLGPSIGSSAIKPEVVAPGEGMYVPTQSIDTNGEMFDGSRYTSTEGTSFAVPMVAGAVALSRQAFPKLNTLSEADRAAALKSTVVNTASPYVYEVDPQSGVERYASIASMGAGKLDAAEATSTLVTVAPATLSFGALSGTNFPVERNLAFMNQSGVPVRLALRLERWTQDDRTSITIQPATFSLLPGSTQPVRVRLEGNPPAPGRYEGVVSVDGTGSRFAIPFLYTVTDGRPYNLLPLSGADFVGQAEQTLNGGLSFKVLDRYGVPVPNVPVEWSVVSGGGRIVGIYTVGGRVVTDRLGISEVYDARLGAQIGPQAFQAKIPDIATPLIFAGRARSVPVINNGGIVNAASGQEGEGVAPGSIVSINGNGLSEFNFGTPGPSLPLSLGGISVSFDNAASNVGYPGRIVSVGNNRVDVQVPWELAGLPTADVKVSLDGSNNSAPITARLAPASPAFWLRTDPDGGQPIAQAWDDTGNDIRSGNRARRGSVVTIRANGLGPVQNQPPSGEPPADGAVTTPLRDIRVTFDGVQAELVSAGLQPGVVGGYLVRVRVPVNLAAGNIVSEIVVSSGGTASPAGARIPVSQ